MVNRDELISFLEHFISLPLREVATAALVLADRFEEWGELIRALDIRWITQRCILENVSEEEGYRTAIAWLAVGNSPIVEIYGNARYQLEIFKVDPGMSGGMAVILSGYGNLRGSIYG